MSNPPIKFIQIDTHYYDGYRTHESLLDNAPYAWINTKKHINLHTSLQVKRGVKIDAAGRMVDEAADEESFRKQPAVPFSFLSLSLSLSPC